MNPRLFDGYNNVELVTTPVGPNFPNHYRVAIRLVPNGSQWYSDSVSQIDVTKQVVKFPLMNMAYDYRQPRREIVQVTVSIGVQDIMGTVRNHDAGTLSLSDPTQDTATPYWYPGRPTEQGEYVQFNGNRWRCTAGTSQETFFHYSYVNGELWDIATPNFTQVTPAAPLPDLRSPTYGNTARGSQTIEHVLLRLRAFLRYRSRCIRATMKISWDLARGLTLRDNVKAFHPSCGEFEGKVVEIVRSWSGSEGYHAFVTVACAVGDGSGASVPVGQDVTWNVAMGTPVVTVNAFLLGDPMYSVLDVVKANEADEQTVAIETAEPGELPTALVTNPTASMVLLRPLTMEPMLELRYGVTGRVERSLRQFDTGG